MKSDVVAGRVGLIGSPLKRQHSAVMHNAAFLRFGIEATYVLRETSSEDLEGFFTEVRDGDWLGFQVTAPHKQAVLGYVDSVSPEAQAIGAVNSGARLRDGSWEGFNTDAAGFAAALSEDLKAPIQGATVVVAGAGGAARAVVWALLDGGAAAVTIGNRQATRAAALANDFAHLGAVRAVELGGDAFRDALATADIAVNATTMGMTTATSPFDPADMSPDGAVFDLVYVPLETPLIAAARLHGLRARNGLDMLVRQAEIAFRRWTGITDSASVMRSALTSWLAESREVDERS